MADVFFALVSRAFLGATSEGAPDQNSHAGNLPGSRRNETAGKARDFGPASEGPLARFSQICLRCRRRPEIGRVLCRLRGFGHRYDRRNFEARFLAANPSRFGWEPKLR